MRKQRHLKTEQSQQIKIFDVDTETKCREVKIKPRNQKERKISRISQE